MTKTSETVYVVQGQNRHKVKYHDGPKACRNSRKGEQFEEITIQEAERRGLDQCKWCAGDVDTTGADFSYQAALKQAAKANAGDN